MLFFGFLLQLNLFAGFLGRGSCERIRVGGSPAKKKDQRDAASPRGKIAIAVATFTKTENVLDEIPDTDNLAVVIAKHFGQLITAKAARPPDSGRKLCSDS